MSKDLLWLEESILDQDSEIFREAAVVLVVGEDGFPDVEEAGSYRLFGRLMPFRRLAC